MKDAKKPPVGGENQGEGDREAARRYNQDQREFVKAGKVDEAAGKAAGQDPVEAKNAEQAGLDRAREFDPEESRDHSKPTKA